MKKILALALALTMVFTFVAGAAFSDVDSSTPAGKAIDFLAEKGIVGGKGDGKFDPTGDVKREEFSKMVYISKTGSTTAPAGKDIFTDVTTANWAYGFITWAYENKIVGGKGDGIFDPGGKIKVAEAAKMLVVALGGDSTLAYPEGFMAKAEADGYFADMAAMDKYKDLNRAETAQMIYNAYFNETVTPGPGPVVKPQGAGLITAINGNDISIAPADKNGRGTEPTAVAEYDEETKLATKNTITYKTAEAYAFKLDTNVKVQLIDGPIGSKVAAKAGTLADIKASTSDKQYYATFTETGDMITEIIFYTTPADAVVVEVDDGLLGPEYTVCVYPRAGETVLCSIFYGPQATPKDLKFTITDFTQPTKGEILPSVDANKFWRLRYTIPADAKIGDTVSFTYTMSADTGGMKPVTATGVVKVLIVKPTVFPDRNLTCSPGETLSFEPVDLYEGVIYTTPKSKETPSILLWDNDKKTSIASGLEIDTVGGGTAIRTSGDFVSYTAPEAAGTDTFYLGLYDGWDYSVAKFTVDVK